MNQFKETNPDSPAHEDWEKAKRLYNQGEYEECLYALSPGFRRDVNYRPLYQLAVDVAAQLDAPEAQELFASVLRNPEDAEAFDMLGNMYIEGHDLELARVFLEKSIAIDPGNHGALHDLAACHFRIGAIDKAIDTLANAQHPDFWTTFWLNKYKILNGDVRGVQESVDQLQREWTAQPGHSEADVRKLRIEDLEETLQRFHRLKGVRPHIRDWQFIQYGGVVLDCYDSPDVPGGGRYASATGTHESMKALANRLKQFVDALSVPVQSVAFLPDRDSEIAGRVFASILGVGCDEYDERSSGNCLVVAAESSLLSQYYELVTVSRGQILFSVWHNWREAAYLCPDIIGFMAQSYVFPWEGGGIKIVDLEKHLFEPLERDDRPAHAIAETICHCDVKREDDTAWLTFYAGQKDYLKGIGDRAGENRYDFIVESPVPGSYFG